MATLTSQSASRLLVAEDDRVMSDVIRFNLERAGYLVSVARNGLDAWQLLQEQPFDLVVLDYQMPGLSGEQVCRNLRRKMPDVRLPVIFLSARGLELSAERLKSELAVECLLFKPFSPRELLETIAASLKGNVLAEMT